MKVFADMNVLVSAFATRGLSADVFQLILSKHELQTGEFNLMELRRILRDKLKLPQHVADEVDNLLRQHHVEPVPGQPSEGSHPNSSCEIRMIVGCWLPH